MDRDQIIGRLRERIFAYAASRIQRDQAEDLTQDVMVVLEEKYREVDALEELLPLALKITQLKMLGAYRRNTRRGEYKTVDVTEQPLPDSDPDPESQAAARQARERLRKALLQLEGRCRELFRLKLEGKSFPEIRVILGANTVNTVYTWDLRCRKQLEKLMGSGWRSGR